MKNMHLNIHADFFVKSTDGNRMYVQAGGSQYSCRTLHLLLRSKFLIDKLYRF